MVNLYKAAVTPPFPRGWLLNTGLTHTLVSQKLDAQLFRHHNIFINILKLVQYGYGLIRFGKNIFIRYRSYVSQRYLSARLNQGLLRKSTRSMLSLLVSVKSRDSAFTAKEAFKVCVPPQYPFSSSVTMTVRRLLFSVSLGTRDTVCISPSRSYILFHFFIHDSEKCNIVLLSWPSLFLPSESSFLMPEFSFVVGYVFEF